MYMVTVKNVLKLEATTRQTGFPLTAEVRGFKVTIDEPEILGGTNKAPNPVEYVVLAQASCLSIVLKLLAQQKKIDLKEIEIDAKSSFDLDAFFKGEPVGLKEIDLTVKMKSSETTETLKKLLEEAERICPVKNTLAAKVTTHLVKAT